MSEQQEFVRRLHDNKILMVLDRRGDEICVAEPMLYADRCPAMYPVVMWRKADRYSSYDPVAAQQARINSLRDALRLAYRHIMAHHDVAKMAVMQLGGICPACHHDDHTEPEMDAIYKELYNAQN